MTQTSRDPKPHRLRLDAQDLWLEDGDARWPRGSKRDQTDQDRVGSQHDLSEEGGDEARLTGTFSTDSFSIDTVEARRRGVALDLIHTRETLLD